MSGAEPARERAGSAAPGAVPLYSERIARRRAAWWKSGGQAEHDRSACREPLPVDPATGAGPAADDPAWHCCRHWQRKLSNKWNSRLFAAAHGVAVPALYWHGRDIDALPWGRLPDRFVIKPVLGEADRGVLVMDRGFERLRGLRLPRALLVPYLRRVLARSEHPRAELLVEEFVGAADGGPGLPDAYKVHVFGGRAVFYCVQRRVRRALWPVRSGKARRSYHHPDGTLLERAPVTDARQDPGWRPPPEAARIVELAERLGRAYGTYVRVDLYWGRLQGAGAPPGAASPAPVFGEFSPTTGLRDSFRAEADRWLGEVWQREIPDQV